VAEWSNAAVSKTVIGASLSEVRILSSPPFYRIIGNDIRLCGALMGHLDTINDHTLWLLLKVILFYVSFVPR
jgi:hypothetical protein